MYALGADDAKRQTAQGFLGSTPTISTQIVNECSRVLRREARWTPDQVARELTLLIGVVRLVDVRLAHIQRAWAVAGRYGFSHFDSLVIATALDAGCDRL